MHQYMCLLPTRSLVAAENASSLLCYFLCRFSLRAAGGAVDAALFRGHGSAGQSGGGHGHGSLAAGVLRGAGETDLGIGRLGADVLFAVKR